MVVRPGVPADLSSEYWWTDAGDAGQITTTAQIGLPSNEEILDAANGLIVSARPEADGYYARVDLVIRDFATGKTLREIRSTIGAPVAVLVGRRLFWSGVDFRSDTDNDHYIDGGVWTAGVDDDNDPRVVVESGREVNSTLEAGRTPFHVSASGHVLSTGGAGTTDIIDTGSLRVIREVTRFPVFAVSDAVAIVADDPPSDYPSGGFHAIDLVSGATLWRFPALDNVRRFELHTIVNAGTSFVFEFLWRGVADQDEFRIAAADQRTGERRVLLRQPLSDEPTTLLYLQSSVTTALHAVLMTEIGPLGSNVQYGNSAVSLLDLKTGMLTRDAFRIDPPFICYDGYCLHD